VDSLAKNDNMLAILWLLRSRGRMSAPQLAESLEISVRTVYRYIDALCASGVPIVAEPGQAGGYTLAANFRGAPLFFEPEELIALFQASAFARQAGYPRLDTLETALQKIRLNLSPEQEQVLQRHATAVGVAPGFWEGKAAHWGRELEEAAANHRTVRLLYQKPGESEPEWRTFDPYALGYRDRQWYVVGRCHLRQAVRDFRLDRIGVVTWTDEHFAPPAAFQINDHLSESWVQRQVQKGPFTLIRLAGTPRAITSIAEHWYMRYCVVERSSDRLLLRMDQTGMPHFRQHLLSFGSTIRILGPDSLRLELLELATRLVENFRQDPNEP